jgi:hypothetical protein
MWNGITCLEYCNIIKKILDENLFWNGVKHIYSPFSKSKYELAVIISKVFELNIEINPIESTETSNKTLSSIYENMFEIPDLEMQIINLKYFFLETSLLLEN